MKYIITDKGEVRTGGGFHVHLAEDCKGKVVAAGHCRIDGTAVEVWGESIGYNIKSKPEDAAVIAASLHTSV